MAGERADALAERWLPQLPPAYRAEASPVEGAHDLWTFDQPDLRSQGTDGLRAWLAPGRHGVRLGVTSSGPVVELSRLVPVLESLGFWVVDELHWDVGPMRLHHFGMRPTGTAEVDPDRDGRRVAAAVLALWEGRADTDGLNRLVTAAGLDWADVAVLRAYRRYRHQVDPRYAEAYVDQVLVDHADLAAALVATYRARFDPDQADPARVPALEQRVDDLCDEVVRLDQDRILRGLARTMAATERTNQGSGGPFAFKLDPSQVPDVPSPVPYREVFVYGPTVEGVHLRSGPVARGGLRLSDRPEDVRAEVLDLMRTQVLKNALIVPAGAKGGFVPRGTGPDAVTRAYDDFVGALLDLTDTDATGPDPYLVVAADKGTAAFSDRANAIAAARGFWLGDAFASGGSTGYDHRALGITARGAWVAVRSHFRDLDLDPDVDPVTVAGVGDMSGDVFGNGMLLARPARLVAAFDHRDVFLDPDPDAEAAWAERARLHALAGSSWQDYDREAISAGGGVWSRSAKRVELSDQARALLRVDADALTPPELVQAVLRAPVDLLYLGGIGTYVRGSAEADATLDDRANAEVRVTADRLRARVVGEGANLGFTQRARVEYARHGGRINMDAIDNAAGVATSDREVNIKILLGLAIDAGLLDPADRPGVLSEVTDDVVAAVLHECAEQCAAIGWALDRSEATLDSFAALQRDLVAGGDLDADLEVLPPPDEYEARRSAGAGLTRPELAVLSAGAKRRIKATVLASDLPDDPATADALVRYFPPALVERFGDVLHRHPLRRELVASEIANDLVDHLGPTAVFDLARDRGTGLDDVAAAAWVVRGVIDADRWWDRIAGVPPAPPDAGPERSDPGIVLAGIQYELTRRELFQQARYASAGVPYVLVDRVAQEGPVMAELARIVPTLERPAAARARVRAARSLEQAGADPATASDLAVLAELVVTPDVALLVRGTAQPVDVVADVFFALGDRLGVDALLGVAEVVPVDGAWSQAARRAVTGDLMDLRREAAGRALVAGAGGTPDVDAWLAPRARALAEADEVRRLLLTEPAPTLEAITVAVRTLRRAVG